ncbi:SAM-dependent methyltransferase [Nocardia sp. NBC_00511]|uniref:class I SAM-dependent methyltransferase n=1 Tax=Nocardia sp. NBC_00511 TaxID=2903591 RepID=UPI002F90A985
MTSRPLVTHVSDTARWVAARRAIESERPDALFKDPLASRLAGERGHQIAAQAGLAIGDDWYLVTRTKLIDDYVTEAIDAGCDLVLNLAAGFDTRPYRMALPDELRWIEVDLPAVVNEKNALLADQQPRCRLTRAAVDLTDTAAVATFLDDALTGAHKALVLTEGLVMYLQADDVVALSSAFTRTEIAWWSLDFSAAGTAELATDRVEGLLSHAPWTFLPPDGVAFFENLGWEVSSLEPVFTAAGRYNRLPPQMRGALDNPQPDPRAPGPRPYSAVIRLTPATRPTT